MAVHTEIVPSGDPALGIGLEALRLARMRMTSNAGSSYWPMGDGTGILAGQQAGDQGLVLVDQHGNRMPLIDTTEISQKADDAISKANAAVDGMEQVREDAENGVKEAKDAAANADSKAQSAIDGMQAVRNEAVKGVKEAKDAASTAQSTAASAASKADKLATELDGTKAIVERHTTKLGEVETKVSNSVEHADQALSASTQAVQTANSVKTTADRAYDDAQSALTQSSTAVQTAGEVKTTLETNYLSKKDSDAVYASKSELKQTSDGITSTVEKTYATKSALEALRNIADNAVETWTGSQKPTASNAPASTWATDQLRKQHAGDVYYDTSTGYSYRWGSTDGETYAWSLIKDSDITKAIADAAKAQSTANGAQKGVDRLDADIPVTYSTKSELRQTSESLTAKVTEAQRVGQSALDKATTVEQTANGLKTTVQEQAQTIKGQTTTIGQLTQKADSLTSSLTQTNQNVETAQSTADTAISRASKLEQTLDGFKTSVSQTYETKADSLKKQSALEQNLNGFKTSVSNTYLSKTDASKTYSTKSELTQTNESLTAKINSTATTANNALSKAASVEATANGLKTTVSEQATTLKGHTSTIGQLTAKADSLTSSLTQTNRNVETALANGAELIRNPECDRTLGNPDGWTNGLTLSASGAPEGAPAPTYGKLSARDTTNGPKVLRRGRTYRFSAWMAHDSTAKKPAALGCFYHESNGNGHWDTAFRVPTSQSGWKQWSGDLTIPKAAREDASVWLQVDGANGSADVTGWYCTLLSIRDVTEAKNAQTTADTAISRASTLEQSLNGFKTTVSQNYETKSDSLAKQSALEQNLSGFKSTVSQTYSPKSEVTDLASSTVRRYTLNMNDKAAWYKIGFWRPLGQGSVAAIHVYTGKGTNGCEDQNSEFTIMLKKGWSGSSNNHRNDYGVNLIRQRNAADVQVKAFAYHPGGQDPNTTPVDIWIYQPWGYGGGHYDVSCDGSWSHQTTVQTVAPVEDSTHTLQASVGYETLSNTSYVDQTSRSVSLGVVEEYKQGRHGSALATSADITAAKDSITSTVSSTYATKAGVTQEISSKVAQNNNSLDVRFATKTETKTAQDTANTADSHASDAQSRVGSLESCIRMTSAGVRVGHIVNGVFQGYSALVNSQGSFDVLDYAGRTVATFRDSILDLLNGLVRLRNANNTGELLIKAPDGTYGYLSYNSDGMFLKSPTGTIRLEPKPGCNVFTRSKAIQPSQAGLCNKATDANGIISVDNLSPPDGNANNGILSVTVTPINIGQDPTLLAFTPVIWAKGANGFQVRLKTNNNTWVSGAQPYAFCWHVVWA